MQGLGFRVSCEVLCGYIAFITPSDFGPHKSRMKERFRFQGIYRLH